MRKFLLMAFAALGLALASPHAASAAPITQGAAINLAVDAVSPAMDVAWHCRRWSGWCRSYWRGRGYYGRRHYWRRHHWRRWR
jgi:hypothetical protein